MFYDVLGNICHAYICISICCMSEFSAVVLGSPNAEVRFVVFVDRTRCTADRFDQYKNNTRKSRCYIHLNIIMHTLLRGSIVLCSRIFRSLSCLVCCVLLFYRKIQYPARVFCLLVASWFVVWTFVSIHHVKPMKQGKLHSFTIHNNISCSLAFGS